MRIARWTVVVLCLIASIQHAAAQPAPEGGPAAGVTAAAEPVDAPAAGEPVDARSDAAWQLYHDAFTALMQGEPARARELASALLRDHPDHPATRLVRSAQLGLAPGAVDQGAAAQRREIVETASRGARAELALFQSLHGLTLGIELCIVLDCDSGQAVFGISLLGAAVGALAPLGISELTSGQRALLNSGTVWGAVNAGLLLSATNNDYEGETIALGLIAGQSAGLVTGAALFRLRPTAGQVALANSAGAWAAVLTELTRVAADVKLNNHEEPAVVMVAIDAGLVAGAYLASRFPAISRGQTLVIDAGGIVGAVGGGGLGIVIAGSERGRTTPALAAIGTLVGLGAAAYFTRDWGNDDEGSLHTYVTPTEHGRGGIAGIAFQW